MKRTGRLSGLFLMAVIGPGITWSVLADSESFTRHVVVAQDGHAADIGRDVLRDGGNAVDAAVATAFALAVTLPEAGNLGGGGFLVAYLADRKEVVTVDFREIAPRASSPGMYLDGGKLRPRYRTGAWAAGVPGTVRGLALAHQRWGKRPWASLVQPAARLAREGFPISDDLAASLNRQLTASRGPASGPAARSRATSAGWATTRSRSPRSASPTTLPGAPVTASFSSIWPTPWTGSPPGVPTSSTPAGLRSSSRTTWATRRLHHARRSEVLRGQAPAARAYHVSRPRRL